MGATKSVVVNGITINIPAGPMPSAEHKAKLDAAFTAVQNTDHWKGPVNKVLSEAHVNALGGVAVVLEAIEFFTATPGLATTFSIVSESLGVEMKVIKFTAPGYWAGPAN